MCQSLWSPEISHLPAISWRECTLKTQQLAPENKPSPKRKERACLPTSLNFAGCFLLLVSGCFRVVGGFLLIPYQAWFVFFLHLHLSISTFRKSLTCSSPSTTPTYMVKTSMEMEMPTWPLRQRDGEERWRSWRGRIWSSGPAEERIYFFGGAFWQILHREFHSESHFWVKGFQGFWDSLDWIQGEMYPKNTFLCSVFFQGKSCKRFFWSWWKSRLWIVNAPRTIKRVLFRNLDNNKVTFVCCIPGISSSPTSLCFFMPFRNHVWRVGVATCEDPGLLAT